MAETYTELFPGAGGSKMDESLVPNTAAGGTAHRANVVPGGADGSLQTFTTETGVTKGRVKDSDVLAQLVTIASQLTTILAELAQKTEPTDTQPVSLTSVPLPTGASTEATLALIKSKTDNIDVALSTRAVTGLTDAQLRAVAVPVSGPLTDTQLRLTAVPVSGPLTDTQLRAVAVPVNAAALPLPAGASTEATLALIKAKTDNIDVALSTRAITGLTDAQLRASALPLPSGAATELSLALRNNAMATLQTALGSVGKKIKLDDIEGGHLYIGRAANGSLTSAAVWEVVRWERNAAGVNLGAQYQSGITWDGRGSGWEA